MLRWLWQLLQPPGDLVRGRPHFLTPPRRGVVAWIPEGRAVQRGGRRVIMPTAIIELHATGVRRRRIGLLRRLFAARRADPTD